ncbi:hypothetical protein C0J08_19330 [Marinomonas sp. CT5]|uniref:DUF3060 domain-containing protein n=1 Tax=Marinomonas sp. CT5 TaxID=2066133 RepID=UPI001BAFD99B|nr:DUF3060 domain-containing protein [Marinomonas sp. CT5]QUX97417.1 hypothetical protein C0J08_19330 [Marinomonas sp. CT5]
MKKALFATLITTSLLTGCASQNVGNSNEDVDTYDISGISSTATIHSKLTTDVNISGMEHIVNIETDVRNLHISGLNNTIHFADGVVVEKCTLSGSDNVAVKTGTVKIYCINSGTDNKGF